MKHKSTKGFTLIELLVVIAIIGILASIVMASLSASRGKGTNASVLTSLAQIRSQASIYVNDFGNYGTSAAGGSCAAANTVFTDASMVKVISALQTNANATAVCNNLTTGLAWSISIKLPLAVNGNAYVCTDATNIIKYSIASPGNVTTC